MSPGAGLSSVEVDSDGSGPRPPVTVLCGVRGGEAVTALTHDTEDKTKVDGFQSPGSFAQSIHYQVSSLALQHCNTCQQKLKVLFLPHKLHILTANRDIYAGIHVSLDN